jgi:hypothetical protein
MKLLSRLKGLKIIYNIDHNYRNYFVKSLSKNRYLRKMFQLGRTIVSEDLLSKDFSCNLEACKGACCVHGDAGAPLDNEEAEILKNIYPKVKPFLRSEGIEAIESQGVFVTSNRGELETPLVQGAECAYVIFDDHQTALCGIEEAFNQGIIDWKKPISCHLYPVRVKAYSEFSAVNYHKWQICDSACTLGQKMKMPIYQFVKDALIRKFGQQWYDDLKRIAESKSVSE